MPEAAYLSLKLARELYQKSPDSLAPDERERVATVAARQLEIERRILSTAEAARVVLPASSVDKNLAEVRGRYETDEEFAADLARIGLTEAGLREALARDLKVETVLERVAGTAAPVTDADVEIFYLMHAGRFRRPETRALRHILITINEAQAGSGREAARAKIDAVHARLAKDQARFAEQALKHSECPTAMNGGTLGQVRAGQLYPELEAVAFALAAGELSAVVESPLGFHVLLCDTISPAGAAPLAEVRDKLRGHLADERRRRCQQAWVATLFKAADR